MSTITIETDNTMRDLILNFLSLFPQEKVGKVDVQESLPQTSSFLNSLAFHGKGELNSSFSRTEMYDDNGR